MRTKYRLERLEREVEYLRSAIKELQNNQYYDIQAEYHAVNNPLYAYQFPIKMPLRAKDVLGRFNEIYEALKLERVTTAEIPAKTSLVKKKNAP